MASEQRLDQEWRLHSRREPRAEVEIRLQEQAGLPSTYCRARNLSAGGMYVDLGLPQPVGSRTMVRFRLPGDSADFVVSCVVVADRPGADPLGTHLEFVEVSDEDRRRIRRFVQRQRQLEAIEAALRA